MKRRHHPLVALGLLAPACAPTPVAHRGSTAQAPAVATPQPATAGDRPDDEGVPTSSSSGWSPTAQAMAGLLAEHIALNGLSQRQFADLVGSTPKHVNLVLNGRATAHPKTLDSWAKALRVRFTVELEDA